MTVGLITHAVTNELGTGTGGTLGDQTGIELRAVPWYRYRTGWIAVYRPRDKQKAEKMARFMEKAVCNGFIGYNQNRKRRKAFFDWNMKNGFNVERLSEPMSTDCGGLAFTAIYSAYRIPLTAPEYDNNGNRIYGVATSGFFDDYLMRDVGDFERFTDALHLESGELLERGDVLLANGHVAMWIGEKEWWE